MEEQNDEWINAHWQSIEPLSWTQVLPLPFVPPKPNQTRKERRTSRRQPKVNKKVMSKRYRNMPPHMLRREFEKALPGLKLKMLTLDNDVQNVLEEAIMLNSNLKFLERKCDCLETLLFNIKVIGFDKLNVAHHRNMQLIKCFHYAFHELNVILGLITEENITTLYTAYQNNRDGIDSIYERLIMRRTEVKELFDNLQSERYDLIIEKKRDELTEVIKQEQITLLNFKLELVAGRIANDRFQSHELFGKLPSECVKMTPAEFASGEIDVFENNCKGIIYNLHHMISNLNLQLERWNRTWVVLRTSAGEVEKSVLDIEGSLRYWEDTIVHVVHMCHSTRANRRSYANELSEHLPPRGPSTPVAPKDDDEDD